jgi:cell division protein FtsI/penicillin-binding protein 2
MANALGREKMAETATVFGIAPVETSEDALKQGRFADIWNVSNRRLANALAPARSAITTGAGLNLYESAIIGMGQGGAGTVTPLQLALIAAAPANMEGKLMKPRIELDQPPQAFSQVLNPQQAREIRDIMSTVTQEAGGTATRALAKVLAAGITTGGKTGTADKDVPKYDADGKVVKRTVRKRNPETGEYYEELQTVLWQRWDGLFLCIAPVENPQIAMMVAIENIGTGAYGGTTAAPIAANILLEARRLGLLGTAPAPARR